MGNQEVSKRDSLTSSIREMLYRAPWVLTASAFRVLYGFHVEGRENLPAEGPFILAICEPSLIGVLVSGWFSTLVVTAALEREGRVVSYMQDQLFALSYFRALQQETGGGQYRALIPHSAGRMGVNLVDGYRTLRRGGVVIMNPQGDGPWDGRPLPTGRSLASLALHSAVPIVPAVCSIGAYDIWPRWHTRPYFGGRLTLKVGAPLVLCDAPLQRFTDQELEQATDRIARVLEELCYGPGGVKAWAGEPSRYGQPLKEPVVLPETPTHTRRGQSSVESHRTPFRRGIAQLLWQCPLCHTNDALVHHRPWFRSSTVRCRACGTAWGMLRSAGKDFRLRVLEGAPDLVGLSMAVSDWYDEMKRGFQPSPITVSDVELAPGEEAYLRVDGVSLLPHRPNPLFRDWPERDAPRDYTLRREHIGQWASIGQGCLVLTNQRLLWRSPDRELDFTWSSVSAVYLWLVNTLGIRYGAARYRFQLGQELGLKWLTHAATLVRQATRRDGHPVTVSHF